MSIEKLVRDALKEREDALRQIGSCGDGGCCVIAPVGQHTNGGCRCVRYPEDKYRAERALRINQRFAATLARSLPKAEGEDGSTPPKAE